jgi:hypothetical protein
MSAATIALNVGTPAVPLGAASTKLAVLLAYGFCVSPYPEAKLITGVVVPVATLTGAVPVTLVTVPPLDGLVFVTVKLGYVPDTLIPVPLEMATV